MGRYMIGWGGGGMRCYRIGCEKGRYGVMQNWVGRRRYGMLQDSLASMTKKVGFQDIRQC